MLDNAILMIKTHFLTEKSVQLLCLSFRVDLQRTVDAGAIPNQVGTSRWGNFTSPYQNRVKVSARIMYAPIPTPSPNVPMGLCFVVDAGAARSMMRGLQPDDYRSHKIDKNQLYFFFLFKAVGFIKDKKNKS